MRVEFDTTDIANWSIAKIKSELFDWEAHNCNGWAVISTEGCTGEPCSYCEYVSTLISELNRRLELYFGSGVKVTFAGYENKPVCSSWIQEEKRKPEKSDNLLEERVDKLESTVKMQQISIDAFNELIRWMN